MLPVVTAVWRPRWPDLPAIRRSTCGAASWRMSSAVSTGCWAGVGRSEIWWAAASRKGIHYRAEPRAGGAPSDYWLRPVPQDPPGNVPDDGGPSVIILRRGTGRLPLRQATLVVATCRPGERRWNTDAS